MSMISYIGSRNGASFTESWRKYFARGMNYNYFTNVVHILTYYYLGCCGSFTAESVVSNKI